MPCRIRGDPVVPTGGVEYHDVMIRRAPVVAGAFYPASPARLRDDVASMVPPADTPVPAKAILVPHAGYTYSGRVAGETYARVEIPRRVCLLATNHTGVGPAFAVWPGGSWAMPGGDVPIDEPLSRAILDGCPGASSDETSEADEHSAEVQLPFIRHRNPGASLAVVTVAYFRLPERERFAACRAFGEGLGRVLRSRGEPVLCVASSDMTHCGGSFGQDPPRGMTADAFARDQDRLALERYLAFDPEGFHRVVRDREVTMCGWAPALVALCAAIEQGATKADLVRYATSAEVSGDPGHVVGYAGVILRS
jgi:AmmeMemoRadiSam system protein B